MTDMRFKDAGSFEPISLFVNESSNRFSSGDS